MRFLHNNSLKNFVLHPEPGYEKVSGSLFPEAFFFVYFEFLIFLSNT